MKKPSSAKILSEAQGLFDKGEFERALRLCERVVASNTKSAAAQVLKGRCLAGLGRSIEAHKSYRSARKLESGEKPARSVAARARALIAEHDYLGALLLCNETVANNPRSLAVLRCRAVISGEAGFDEQAVSDYDELVRRQPESGRALMERACYHYRMNRMVCAHQDFAEAVKLEPSLESEIERFKAEVGPIEPRYDPTNWPI